MEPTIEGREAVNHGEQLVHARRVSQLKRLGIPEALAEAHADNQDWALGHSVAAGVWGGCTDEERRAIRSLLISDGSGA
jgi:hypothetical protein